MEVDGGRKKLVDAILAFLLSNPEVLPQIVAYSINPSHSPQSISFECPATKGYQPKKECYCGIQDFKQ